MRRNFLILVTLLAASSCTDFLKPRFVEVVELGALVKQDTLARGVDTCSFPLLSNVDFTAKVVSGAEWLSFSDGQLKSLSCPASTRRIAVRSTANTGFPRMALVTLEAKGRSDTVYVKQEGKYDQFVHLGTTQLEASAQGGTYEIVVETNLPARDILTSADKEGIESAVYVDNAIFVTLHPNSGRNDRTINLEVYCVNAWREHIGEVLTIKQPKL